MITVDTIGRVRRAYFVQGRKIKAIARELKLGDRVGQQWKRRAAQRRASGLRCQAQRRGRGSPAAGARDSASASPGPGETLRATGTPRRCGAPTSRGWRRRCRRRRQPQRGYRPASRPDRAPLRQAKRWSRATSVTSFAANAA